MTSSSAPRKYCWDCYRYLQPSWTRSLGGAEPLSAGDEAGHSLTSGTAWRRRSRAVGPGARGSEGARGRARRPRSRTELPSSGRVTSWGSEGSPTTVREQRHGKAAFYNVNRYLNPTTSAGWTAPCASWAKKVNETGGYEFAIDASAWRRRGAVQRGRDRVPHRRGAAPDVALQYYTDSAGAQERFPAVHLKAFTMSRSTGSPTWAAAPCPRPSGTCATRAWDSCPGGGAEIFERKVATSSEEQIRESAGSRSPGMPRAGYPHERHDALPPRRDGRGPRRSLLRLRALQDETGGFTGLIPLAFHPENTPLANLPATSGQSTCASSPLRGSFSTTSPTSRPTGSRSGRSSRRSRSFFSARTTSSGRSSTKPSRPRGRGNHRVRDDAPRVRRDDPRVRPRAIREGRRVPTLASPIRAASLRHGLKRAKAGFSAAGLLVAASISAGCIASGYRTKPRIAIADGDPVVQMAPSAKSGRAPIPGGSRRTHTHTLRPGTVLASGSRERRWHIRSGCSTASR